MATSKAETVTGYLAELPPERRAVLEAVRKVVRANLAAGFGETMSFGMIAYGVPLTRYPNTYNKQPLAYAALAAQKNYYALYLMGVYGDATAEKKLRAGFAAAGKKLDMGKSCIRFRKVEDLPLDVIGEAIASMTPDDWIARYEASRRK